MQRKKTLFFQIILASLVVLFARSYGKWEYLSWRHGHEFFEPIKRAADRGCLIGYAEELKVMSYSETRAEVWYKDDGKNTYLAIFQRLSSRYSWDPRAVSPDGDTICTIEMINSKMGGSADELYWYN